MKTFEYIKIAKSLCAVILAVGVLFFALQPKVFAEETTEDVTEQADVNDTVLYDPDNNQPYKYYIEIEFGPMQFYYDWGKWDPSSYRYKANDSSINPSYDTSLLPSNSPGWYGFDGISNKISIINKAENPEETAIDVSIEFTNKGTYVNTDITDDTPEELYFPLIEHCITMSCYYKDSGTGEMWGNEVDKNGDVYVVTSATKEPVDVYLSFSGEPIIVNGNEYEKFISPVMQQVGFITVTVSAHDSGITTEFEEELPEDPLEESSETTSTETTSTETTSTETTSTEETSTETTSTETTSTEETSTEETSTEETSTETTSTETTSTEETSTEETSTEATSTEETSVEETSTETNSDETASTETSSEETTAETADN